MSQIHRREFFGQALAGPGLSGIGPALRAAETIERALRYAFGHIRPNDVVLLGVWQKHLDQVSDHARLVRRVLTAT
jgi:hypothetical protein